ncbi:MAG TPA: OsmC family peroxiredoxin [Dehalococcoidia bacterium]|nr:OsmC family peroxiredoxin [Dehalococcoidia bacterium]
MPLMQTRANVTWSGNLRDGSGTLTPGSGAFPELPLTFAARTESQGGKTNPEELLASAHAICYAMVMSNVLTQEAGAPPERIEVEAVATLDRIDGALKITNMQLNIGAKVAGIDAARFETLAREGEQRCPVSNALRGNVEIAVSARLL